MPHRALLASPSAQIRLTGIDRWREAPGDVSELAPLLADDAPVVHAHGGYKVITEVRADVLVALQDRYRLANKPWDLGPVQVRKAMPADLALRRTAELPAARRASVEAAVDEALDQRVRPDPADRDAVRAYLILQRLGEVPYETQSVDPATWLTPLQAQVHGTQLRSDRSKPHLRCEGEHGPVGFVYRDDRGRWVLDFDESPTGREVRADVQRWMQVERAGVPRVRFADGQPVTDRDGAFVLDGVVPRDTDRPVDFLRSVGAFVARRHRATVVE